MISGLRGWAILGVQYPGAPHLRSDYVSGPAHSVPRMGILGAALASLLGYGATMLVALFWLMRKRGLRVLDYLRPRYEDIPILQLES